MSLFSCVCDLYPPVVLCMGKTNYHVYVCVVCIKNNITLCLVFYLFLNTEIPIGSAVNGIVLTDDT